VTVTIRVINKGSYDFIFLFFVF